jgi:predicted nucleic acid-binding protein
VRKAGRIILDTGPLVALLNGRDTHHDWAKARFAAVKPPLITPTITPM